MAPGHSALFQHCEWHPRHLPLLAADELLFAQGSCTVAETLPTVSFTCAGFVQLSQHGQPPSGLAVQGAAELAAAASAADAAAAQLLEEEEREAAQHAARMAAKAARRQRQRARKQQAATAEQQGSRQSMEAAPLQQGADRGLEAHLQWQLASEGGATTAHPADESEPEQLSCPPSTAHPDGTPISLATSSHAGSQHLTVPPGDVEAPAAEGTSSEMVQHSPTTAGCSGPATADFATQDTPTSAHPSPRTTSTPHPPCCPAAEKPPSATASAPIPPQAPAPAPALCLGDDLLSELCCPITQEPMQDPVLAADGQTYERSAIQGGPWKDQIF